MPTYRAKIEKFDGGFFLRLPEEAAHLHGLEDGTEINLVFSGLEFDLKARQSAALGELFGGKTDTEWRAIYRECDFDWGPDVGREIIED